MCVNIIFYQSFTLTTLIKLSYSYINLFPILLNHLEYIDYLQNIFFLLQDIILFGLQYFYLLYDIAEGFLHLTFLQARNRL